MSNGIVTRRDIDSLSDSELTALKNAYARFHQLNDDRGFNHLAGFHDVPGRFCHIEDPYVTFLPWHRAYLHWFEQALRDIDETVSVPYWDWTKPSVHQHGVPAAFSTRLEQNGDPNPLFSSKIRSPFENRETRRFPRDPARLKTQDYNATKEYVQDLIDTALFEDFTRDLEGAPHGSLHVWTGGTGGDMSNTSYAAFDPIFFSHHCMIDKIWHEWQVKNGVNNIFPETLERTMVPFDVKVKDLLDIGSLGYNYG